MNKNLKKLGLLIVAAIAMAMGVNSASALRIGVDDGTVRDTDKVTANSTISDRNGGNVSVVVNNGTHTVTLNSNFGYKIVVENGDYVTINLNGYKLTGNVYVDGTVIFNGNDNENSGMTGNLTNRTGGNITIDGGNFAAVAYTAGGTSLTIKGLGTLVSESMKHGVKDTTLYKLENVDNYYRVVEADADISKLQKAINGTNGLLTNKWNASNIIASEASLTKSSFATWKAAYDAAMDLLNGETLPVSQQDTVDTVKLNYIAAVNGLKWLATDSYDALEAVLNDVEGRLSRAEKQGIVYTDAILAQLNEAIARATADMDLPADRGKSNNSLDAMIQEIKDIYALLPSNHKANYSSINDLEEIISVLNEEDYSSESWSILTFVQSTIERDLTEANQAKVNQYYAQLKAAVKGLVRVNNSQTVTPGDDEPSNPGSTEPSNPGSTEPSNPGSSEGGNNNPGSTVNPNTDGTTSDVNTGDNVAVYAVMNIASLIALAGCGLVLRKQN